MDNNPKVEKRLIFQANAVAFGAHVRRPDDFIIPSVASSCLPVTGGFAEAASGRQVFRDIVSFESAYTRAQGDYADTRRAADFTQGNFEENELPANIFVESTVKGLKFELPLEAVGDAAPVIRRLTIEQLYVRMEATCDRKSPTAFRSLETAIAGVALDDHPLSILTAERVFGQYDTHAKLCKAYAEDSDFRKQYSGLFYPSGHEKSGLTGLLSGHEIPNFGGIVLGTIVTGMEWQKGGAADVVIAGNRLDIQGIGSIFFGEIIVEPLSRRVTLLRFQLGSCHGGDGSAGDVQAMVHTIPPVL